MGIHNRLLQSAVLLSLTSLSLAAIAGRESTLGTAARTAYRGSEKSSFRQLAASAEARTDTTSEEGQLPNTDRSTRPTDAAQPPQQVERKLFLGSRWMPLAGEDLQKYDDNAEQVHVASLDLKSDWQVIDMWREANNYKGAFKAGMSLQATKLAFDQKLSARVATHVSNFVAGSIRELGDFATITSGVQTCVERPSLTLTQVQKVAKDSFGIPDFKPVAPSCDNGGLEVSCNYDTGKCCRRPQVEFIARYFDRAVAAMALGATRDEAFAPLIHLRSLASVLEACDPQLSFRGNISSNGFWYNVRGYYSGSREEYWTGENSSLISLPVAYEVMYELYSAMLLERVRTRKQAPIPTDAEMLALNNAVYYKKMMAVVVPFDHVLNHDAVFPDASDFAKAGLVMPTSIVPEPTDFLLSSQTTLESSVRTFGSNKSALGSSGSTLDPSKSTPGSSGMEVEPTRDSDLRPSVRDSGESFSVYELQTNTTLNVDTQICDGGLNDSAYFPFQFHPTVWDKFEACCANECNFLALYGLTSNAARKNCCAGCNRHKCVPNNVTVAEYVANINVIQSSSKVNSGAEVVTFVV